MLQHHAQYYSSHKIHELQERAIKSPTPKASMASASPSTQTGGPPSSQSSQPNVPSSQVSNAPTSGKQTPGDITKESRSPPPQRHVHTHHHTHVGLGYPMYPAPYGGLYNSLPIFQKNQYEPNKQLSIEAKAQMYSKNPIRFPKYFN